MFISYNNYFFVSLTDKTKVFFFFFFKRHILVAQGYDCGWFILFKLTFFFVIGGGTVNTL